MFKTYPEFKKLVHGLSEVAAGGSGRAKLPILGPNPYSIDFMDGDEKNAKIRLEFTMKRLTDVIDIVMKCVAWVTGTLRDGLGRDGSGSGRGARGWVRVHGRTWCRGVRSASMSYDAPPPCQARVSFPWTASRFPGS